SQNSLTEHLHCSFRSRSTRSRQSSSDWLLSALKVRTCGPGPIQPLLQANRSRYKSFEQNSWGSPFIICLDNPSLPESQMLLVPLSRRRARTADTALPGRAYERLSNARSRPCDEITRKSRDLTP